MNIGIYLDKPDLSDLRIHFLKEFLNLLEAQNGISYTLFFPLIDSLNSLNLDNSSQKVEIIPVDLFQNQERYLLTPTKFTSECQIDIRIQGYFINHGVDLLVFLHPDMFCLHVGIPYWVLMDNNEPSNLEEWLETEINNDRFAITFWKNEITNIGLIEELEKEYLNSQELAAILWDAQNKTPQQPWLGLLSSINQALQQRRIALAEKLLVRCMHLFPYQMYAYILLSDLLEQKGFSLEAYIYLDYARKIHPTSPELLVRLAKLQEKQGDLEQSLITFREALYHAPLDCQTELGIGRILLRRLEYSSSIEHIKNVLHREPENLEAWALFGEIGWQNHDHYIFSLALRKIYAINPKHPNTFYLLHKMRKYEDQVLGESAKKENPLISILIKNRAGNESKRIVDMVHAQTIANQVETIIIQNELQGVNEAIRISKGKYIIIIDPSLERLNEDALEKLVSVFEEDPHIGVVYTDSIIRDKKSGEIKDKMAPNFDRTLLFQFDYASQFFIWRKSLCQEFGDLDSSIGELMEYDYLLRVSEMDNFIHWPEFLCVFNPPDSPNKNSDNKRIQIAKRYWLEEWGPFPPSGKVPVYRKKGELVESWLYINTGNGYSDTEKIGSSFWAKDNYFHHGYNLQQWLEENKNEKIVAIRFDPLKGYRCRCRIEQVLIDGKLGASRPRNAKGQTDGYDEFVTTDPRYEIIGHFDKVKQLSISGIIELRTNTDLSGIGWGTDEDISINNNPQNSFGVLFQKFVFYLSIYRYLIAPKGSLRRKIIQRIYYALK